MKEGRDEGENKENKGMNELVNEERKEIKE